MDSLDFVVIGGGSAGYAAARTAARQGLKTALVEGADELGGLCILHGCMPSKTLIESANRFQAMREADEFGLYAGELGFSGKEIIERKRRLIREFARYRVGQLKSGEFELIRGVAKFTGPHRVEIARHGGGTRALEARAILVATGSVIHRPPFPGMLDARPLTSDDVLENPNVPASLIVLGAGPVAMELAHYHAALGTRVTILQRSGQVLKTMDADVAGIIHHEFERRGIRVICNTHVTALGLTDSGKSVTFQCGGEQETLEAEEILLATGRDPATARLDLEAAGLPVAPGCALRAGRTQQTAVPHIFAAGDVTGELEIVHIAIEQGEIAARNAARLVRGSGEPLEEMDYRLKLFAVFTRPEAAMVGLTEREARAEGRDFLAASYPFNDHGKSMVMCETEGFVKLLADRPRGEIIGGAVVGPHAADLIHEIVVAMHYRATVAEFARIPHYHPTLSEIWGYPAGEIADALAR